MGILDEDIGRVREQTDLVALVGEKVALRRVGQRYLGLCPFHQEKTPSFNVNPTLGFYDRMGGERLLNEQGRFDGAYAWRDAEKLIARR